MINACQTCKTPTPGNIRVMPASLLIKLLQQGTYPFIATDGDIDLTLSSDASFHRDASTNNGSISSDFSTIRVTTDPNTNRVQAHGDVGQRILASSLKFALTANNGAMRIHRIQGGIVQSLTRISVMDSLSGDPRMALQADSYDKQDRMYPYWKAEKSSQKGHPRFRLLFLASGATLEAQQAERPRSRLRD